MSRAFALLVVILTACSGGSVAPDGEGSASPAGDGVAPNAVEASCSDQMDALLATLEELDGRLDVGLVFADYSERVGDASVAYNRLDIEEIEPNCLERVAIPLENAMNAYIRAQNTWNDCIQSTSCDNDSITPSLQREWAKATDLIDNARGALDE